MKEKLKNIIRNPEFRRLRIVVSASALVVVVVAGGVLAFYPEENTSKKIDSDVGDNTMSNANILIAVVGEEELLMAGNSTSSNSWPGEIISLNNLQVQPDREGTISEWYVRIGERVRAGQLMGKLSRPPQTPEAIMALSEKEQMLSEARTNVGALRVYTTKRIAQLKQLKIDTENSNKQKIDLLQSDTLNGDSALLSLIASKKKMAQEILRGSISKIFPIVTNQTIVPSSWTENSFLLRWAIGATDSNLRNSFPNVLFGALTDLKDKTIVPEKSGLYYFETSIRLANASIVDGESLSEESLESLKQMLYEDQAEFVTVLGEIKSMELERVNTQRESIDTLAEIDAMIADMEKELALMEGEVKAKEVAYNTIKGSITSGYSIVAPKSGVVSNIMKQPGEFVGPGMPVATVTAGNNDGLLVRMRIPNNIQKPQIGETLSIIRPGFATDVQKAHLIGVGSSLNEDGSYMADAVFLETTKWSVGASVRVLAPTSSTAVRIRYTSVSWGEGGVPMVWAVSEADRIFTKKITIGRTLGDLVEVYEGLANGDRYIVNPTSDIHEDMLLSELVKEEVTNDSAESGEDDAMGGMVM